MNFIASGERVNKSSAFYLFSTMEAKGAARPPWERLLWTAHCDHLALTTRLGFQQALDMSSSRNTAGESPEYGKKAFYLGISKFLSCDSTGTEINLLVRFSVSSLCLKSITYT